MINASNYTKVLKSYDEFMEDWELYGFIKEEENKYYLLNLAGEEGLVYDFTINLGDTVTINNPFGFMPYEAIITSIDSVFIEPANEYRKQITLFDYLNYGYEEKWIEGIGSLAGITESGWDMTILTGADDYTLLCYYEESELWHKTDLYSLCFYPLVGVPAIKQPGISTRIFPNPIRNISILELNNPDNRTLTIKIYNSIGTKVEEFKITTPRKVNIFAKDYSKGVYFYQVIENYQPILNQKFIVL